MQFFRAFAYVALVGIAAPAAAQNTDWSGFYARGQAELANVDLENDDTVSEGRGLLFGASGGYRYDLGNVVLGVTASALFGDVDISPNTPVDGRDPTLDTLLRAGIEVGYELGPVLVTGGLGQTLGIMTDTSDRRRSEVGSFYEFGLDYLLTEDVIIGADVTRTNLDNFSGSDVSVTSFGLGAAFRF